jgi:hypothetical protein
LPPENERANRLGGFIKYGVKNRSERCGQDKMLSEAQPSSFCPAPLREFLAGFYSARHFCFFCCQTKERKKNCARTLARPNETYPKTRSAPKKNSALNRFKESPPASGQIPPSRI